MNRDSGGGEGRGGEGVFFIVAPGWLCRRGV